MRDRESETHTEYWVNCGQTENETETERNRDTETERTRETKTEN